MLVWIDRCEALKGASLLLCRLWINTIDSLDLDKRSIALAVFRRANATRNVVACPQVKSTDLGCRYVNIVGTLQQAGITEEAKPVRIDLEGTSAGCILYIDDLVLNSQIGALGALSALGAPTRFRGLDHALRLLNG